ncbi:MAG: hypothetical protein KAX50_01335, partial [Saprospiraceae bacterium]|nr:hypothetical protein [Saprospiraceae bacterium]
HKSKIFSQLKELYNFILGLFSGKKVPKKPPALRSPRHRTKPQLQENLLLVLWQLCRKSLTLLR